MKANVLLLVDADHTSVQLASLAAVKTGHHVVRAQTSREAFGIIERELKEIDVIVINLDPGVHGMAVLEAMHLSADAPPVIVLTGLEEAYMRGIAAVHGAAACLGKPFTAEKLASMIEHVTEPSWRSEGCTCDAWGHPHRCPNCLVSGPSCRRPTQLPVAGREYANV